MVERRGVHPAWISVAAFAGAAVALLGAWFPLSAARDRARTTEARAQALAAEVERHEALAREQEARQKELADAAARARESAAQAKTELEGARAEVSRLEKANRKLREQRPAEAPAQGPGGARKLQGEAHVFVRQGRFREALERMNLAVEAAPRDANLLVDRAYVRLQLSDLQGATQDCKAALVLDPRHALAWNNLAMIQLTSGDASAAHELALRSLQCDSNLVNAWIMRLSAAVKISKWSDAELSGKEALERLRPGDPRRAVVESKLQQARKALAEGE